MVVTIRKFLSLLISIVWFRNPFTLAHWVGAALVFTGTLAFADIWTNHTGTAKENRKKKKEVEGDNKFKVFNCDENFNPRTMYGYQQNRNQSSDNIISHKEEANHKTSALLNYLRNRRTKYEISD
uniref:Uncharacterized protein n=1 Tax=Wuchereria bancrofti TaxID=6293 RepID=A0AAF5PSP1_WUCBA